MSEPGTWPPWVWENLTADERTQLWRRLAAWVEWLEQAYAPWVVLPPCWPKHEGLCAELVMFWAWFDRLIAGDADPADGVRWHAELRQATRSWQELATCEHRPPGPEQERIRVAQQAQRDQFVAEAAASDEYGWRNAEHGWRGHG